MAKTRLTGKVQTVLGPIDADTLGVTLPHEHLMVDSSCYFTEPNLATEKTLAYQPVTLENLSWIKYNLSSNLDNMKLQDEKVAINEAILYKASGGNTIVDASSIGCGRDPAALVRIAQITGLNIIMGSGYYMEVSHPPDLESKSEVDIANEIVRDLTDGVDGSQVCAGIIGEIGCTWPWSKNERKVMSAAVYAQRCTGAPLVIHPGRSPLAPFEIIEMLREKEADLRHTVFCHVDRTFFDLEARCKLAEAGCYLEFDQFGWEGYFDYPHASTLPSPNIPNSAQRIDHIAELISKGFINQILISQDTCTKIQLTRYGGLGYACMLRRVVPLMRLKGFSDENIHTILVENPKSMLQRH